MKPTKTIDSYASSIRSKYLNDKESVKVPSEIMKLTRANIKKLVLNLFDVGLSNDDQRVLSNFFDVKHQDTLRRKIKSIDSDRFRPICEYLRGNQGSLQSHDAVELMAVLLDFKPRPYRKYLKEEITNGATGIIEDENETQVSYPKEANDDIKVKPKRKGLFHWVSTASAQEKWKIIGAGVIVITLIIFSSKQVLSNNMRWMVWDQDHYVEVKLDFDQYDIGQLKIYKQERIDHFKRILVDCNTAFFDNSGAPQIWYGKNAEKTLEFFTSYGLHPETGKTLKPITTYMIGKYVCPTQNE